MKSDYENQSAMRGLQLQEDSKARLKANVSKHWHQDSYTVHNMLMQEKKATDSNRLEMLLKNKWYDDRNNWKFISKIDRKAEDRIRRVMSDR